MTASNRGSLMRPSSTNQLQSHYPVGWPTSGMGGPLRSTRRKDSPPTSIYDQIYDLDREEREAEAEALAARAANKKVESGGSKAIKRQDYHHYSSVVGDTGYAGPIIEISHSGHGG